MRRIGKAAATFIALAQLIVLASCSDNSESKEKENEAKQSVSITENSYDSSLEEIEPYVPDDIVEETTQEETELICFSELIPIPSAYFANGEESILDPDGGESYSISVKNATKEEYVAYVEACKLEGFDDISHESENMFEARTADQNYYVSLQYWVESEDDASQNSVNISCGIPRKG